MAKDEAPAEVARFYTRTRRFPKFIGKFTDGTKIPGGPYTLFQGAALAIVAVIGFVSRPLWSFGSVIVEFGLVILLAWGASFLAGLLPIQRRNLLSVAVSLYSAVSKPASGRIHGHTVQVRSPHAAFAPRGAVFDPADPYLVPAAASASPEVAPAPVMNDPQPTTAAVKQPVALTGVERLLLQTQGK